MKGTLTSIVLTATLAAPLALAEVDIDKVDDALKTAEQYGFSHYTEIEFEEGGKVEVEGWIDDSTDAEVDFAADGTVSSEDKEAREGGPKGVSADTIRYAVETARTKGVTSIESISSEQAGEVEIEGKAGDGKAVELNVVTAQRD